MRGHQDAARDYLTDAIRRDPSTVAARQLLVTLEAPANPARALQLCEELQQLAPGTAGLEQCVENNRRRLQPSTP
jgi:hypothetical protein